VHASGRTARDKAQDTVQDTLLIFAKAPVPGRVKTRLAPDLGAEGAARLYADMGRAIVGAVASGRYASVVCYDPPDALDAMRAWLGDEVVFRAQSEGDLGRRLAQALGDALETSGKVVVIGTDAPAVDRSLVERAFEALDDVDLVLGPAEDGGYYLLGLDRLEPSLFDDMPWSTDGVLARTLEAAEFTGMSVQLLETLRDIDTVRDLER
jgi:uncharacterized protein